MRYALLTLVLVTLCAETIVATNSVVIQSDSVAAGPSEVTIGVYIQNDAVIAGLVLPLQIRTVAGDAFIADTLSIEAANRMTVALTGITVKSYFPSEDNNRYWECGGDGFLTRGLPDFISPDAMFYAAVAGEGDSMLWVGTDGTPPGGTPSFIIRFGVNSQAGMFEIDTTCITPANHLAFGRSGAPLIIPNFTKGVITVGCDCDCHTDPQCDGYYDIVDWLKIKNVAQGYSGPIPDPNPFCPVVTTDVNCDGVTNNTDKNLMYGVVFLGDNPDSVFCNPCP